MEPGPKTKYAFIAKELITLLENVKFVLIAWKLDFYVMSARPEVKYFYKTNLRQRVSAQALFTGKTRKHVYFSIH